ncbi:ribonuclease R [Thioalkalivibrio paradoxus]|uniref:Ribonuclease R n=1 Tax=Thioalkalivibrio paradoxus ARh 1 TaxID=713585 RepID=W0DKF2_9GAMM|nr:ribonuclease R [Thioalkalivibrio paradoxus]AHE97488.1 exoribonuclease R [Thioalkalivibrio paradoxus ARh 1]
MPRKRSQQPQVDPYFEREAQKYDNPIASRELILELLVDAGNPLGFDEIAERLEIGGDDQTEALRRRLRAMERDGQVLCNRRGAYLPVSQADLIRGRVIGHPDGFGFLVPDDQTGDLFLSPRQMRGVLHGDRVLGRVMGVDHRGRREGGIIEILERGSEQIVGRIRVEDGVGVVTPDNKRITHDILIPPDGLGEAGDDQIVVVRIRPQASRKARLRGEVIEVLGEHMAPGMEIDIAIRAHGLPFQWPDEVTAAADRLGAQVPAAAKRGRLDLRKKPLVTIDGEDARDFDDALYCEETETGWRLWVAIADVSHYVEKDSALDQEARTRGTSVYFPNQVIPMLPEVLSNGLCSLNPDVDRLCMLCEMEIGKRGAIRGFRFHEGVMRSHARLTYTQVAAMLVDGDEALREQYAAVVPHLERLYAVFRALNGARNRRGAIDFDSTETRIEFGPERKIERIVPVERTDAHRLVEECMIAANVSAAKFLKKYKIPALYRLHDRPPPEKIDALRDFLSGVGLTLEGGDEPTPVHYAAVLRAAAGRPDWQLIQTVLLRSLSQANYGPSLSGHFGLALADYAHFTSPIRRYPDLLVHRGIRHVLRDGKARGFAYSHSDMEHLGEHCSMAERRADDATRDAVAWLKAEYMQDKVGDVFDGVVSGVTGFGLFVEIVDVFIDGLVHVTSLDNDYYHFDPIRHRLTGERSGRTFRIGDRLRVQVIRVSLDDRKIDLRLIDEERPARPGKRRQAGAAQPPAGETTPEAPAAEQTPPRRRGRRRGAGTAGPSAEASTRAEGDRRADADTAQTQAGAEGAPAKPARRKRTAAADPASGSPRDPAEEKTAAPARKRPSDRRGRSGERKGRPETPRPAPEEAGASADSAPDSDGERSSGLPRPRRRRRSQQAAGEVALLIQPSRKTGDQTDDGATDPANGDAGDAAEAEAGGKSARPARRSSRRRPRDDS